MKVSRTTLQSKLSCLKKEIYPLKLVVELGSGLGLITQILCDNLNEPLILAIDLFNYKKGQQYPLGKSVINLYEDQLKIFHKLLECNVFVIPIKASAIALAEGFPDKYADLIIIDLGDEISNQAAYNLWKNKATHIIEITD